MDKTEICFKLAEYFSSIMKILYVTHKMIYPVTGGDCIRMSQVLDALLRRGDVDVMYIAHSDEAGDMKSHNAAIGGEWCLRVPYWRRLVNGAATLCGRLPLLVNLYRHKAFARRLLEVAPSYDMVVLGSLGVAHYCMDLKKAGIDCHLDLTDSATMNLDNEAALAHGFRRWWHRINARRMRRIELLWRATAKSIAFISEVDRCYLRAEGERSVIVGNMVDVCCDEDRCRQDSDNEILFVGKMDYAPNIAAVRRFASRVMPAVTAATGDVVFRVVGASPVAEVKALERMADNISVEGFVEDLNGCYRSASVFVAPMFSGSGIQNKILQAMSAGCCVVTTPIGAEGLDMASGAFVVARGDADLTQACIDLLRDREMRLEYGRRARRYVAGHFSREVVDMQMRSFLMT